MPGDNEAPVDSDLWVLVSLVRMEIVALNDEQRKALGETAAELELLQKEMAKVSTPGRGRIANALKEAADAVGPLLHTSDDEKWRLGSDLRSWCKLARQPAPDPSKLSMYLGTLACQDVTDKAYLAQRLIERVIPDRLDAGTEPNAFLDAFKACPAFGRIPSDLKSQLQRAAQEDREKAEKRKENPEKIEPPTPPKAPNICDEPSTAGANEPPVTLPSSARR